jgi:D-alanyl-D-alanine dipeptidase
MVHGCMIGVRSVHRAAACRTGRYPTAWRLALWLIVLTARAVASGASAALPHDFVYLDAVVPDIRTDMRYSGRHNFVGQRIDGYLAPRAILTREAANALEQVQAELRPFGLGLLVFDAYRPQRAVDHFVRWARDLQDDRMKAEFYPGVAKQDLFREDYIAARSSHSRGSTVDLTLVALEARPGDGGLDMGTGFDFFGPQSWPDYAGVTPAQRAHRLLLRTLMQKHGFTPYPKEWWHFTLANEPFPDTWFDFPVL